MNKKKIIITAIISLVIIAILAVNIAINLDGGKKESATATEITTTNIVHNIECTGVLKESKSKSVYLDTTVPIKKINFKKFDYVKKGDILAIMDTSSISTTYETQVIDKKATKKAQKKAAMEQAKQLKQNQQNSNISNAPTVQSVDYSQQLSQYQQMMGTQTNSTGTLNPTQNSTSLSSSANVVYKTVTKTNKDAVKRKNKIIELTKAPINGIIAEINVVENGYANTMMASFVIINTDEMKAIANVKESDISKVSVGMPVTITGDSIDENTTVTGKITKIAPIASNIQSATGIETSVETTIKIDKNNYNLLPNANVTCTIKVAEKENVTVVSFNMLKEDKDGNKSVFVINKLTGELTETPVKLGLIADVNAEVIEGVSKGDLVCSSPLSYYKTGMKVDYTITED